MIKPEDWKAASEMAMTMVTDTDGMDNEQRVWTFLACTIHSLDRLPVIQKVLAAYTCAQHILNNGVKAKE